MTILRCQCHVGHATCQLFTGAASLPSLSSLTKLAVTFFEVLVYGMSSLDNGLLRQVSRVVYPGLPDHPYFPRVQKLLGGQAGGVVSFELTGGAPAAELMFQVQF